MESVASSSSATRVASFAEAARAVVSTNFVRAAGPEDAIAGVHPQTIVEPGDEQELAAVLKLANEEALAIIPRGGGTKLAWGNPPKRANVVLSTARLNRVIEHAWADLTVTVEAGCTIQDLQDTLAQHGQRLAVDPLWPDRATVGGVLSTNDSGVLRLRFGALRDLIIGITLALPDGTLAKSGGRVVKNVAGYDLPKLVTGALGTLGIITRAIFRLHPQPKEIRTVSCLTHDLRDAQRLLLEIQDSQLAHSALQIRFVESTPPQIDVLFEATEAGLAAQIEQLKAILGTAPITDSGPVVWKSRQELYGTAKRNESPCAVAKISVLPARIAEMLEKFVGGSDDRVRRNAVVQGTGIGCVYLEGEPSVIGATLSTLRAGIESCGGSLFVAHRHTAIPALDSWGAPGDAVPLMRAVKQQFDPRATLNPGRFVGGI
jgi:glycolate dehydrogenase FAD-binding subunit